jgi:excisionase family DNA binding protein
LVDSGIYSRTTLNGDAFSMPDAAEILTIREVADLLKIGEKTAYTMAQRGELPGFKVRGQWRFRRTDIDQWIARQVERGTKGVDVGAGGSEGEQP